MPSVELIHALEEGNLEQVQALLVPRDDRGVPLIDINDLRYAQGGYSYTAIAIVMLRVSSTAVRNITQQQARVLVQHLLSLRDRDNNLVIDLNRPSMAGKSALLEVIMRGDSQLLQLLLDARTADGELALDFNQDVTEFFSPLQLALREKKLPALQLLVDARRANGQPIYSDEQLKTALTAFAIRRLANHEINFSSSVTANWLNTYLAQRGIDVVALARATPLDMPLPTTKRLLIVPRAQLNRSLPPTLGLPVVQQAPLNIPLPPTVELPIAQQAARPEGPAPVIQGTAREFHQERQNTHNTEVTLSVDASLKRLISRYGRPTNINPTLTEVRSFIKDYMSSGKRRLTLICLNRIENMTMTRMGCELTLSQALALMWQALNDQNAAVDGIETPVKAADIHERKRGLVNRLYEAQTEYDNRPICFVGTMNKIAEAGNNVHPDVSIAMGLNSLLPLAKARAKTVVRDKFFKKSHLEQRAIMRTWAETAEPAAAQSFRTAVKVSFSTMLAEEYQVLLNVAQRQEVVDTIDIFTPEDILPKLLSLMNAVAELAREGASPELLALKAKVAEAFADKDLSLDDEYQALIRESMPQLRAHLTTPIDSIDATCPAEFKAAIQRFKQDLGALTDPLFCSAYAKNLSKIKQLRKLIKLDQEITHFGAYGTSIDGYAALQIACKKAINTLKTDGVETLITRLQEFKIIYLRILRNKQEKAPGVEAKRCLSVLEKTFDSMRKKLWKKETNKENYERIREIFESFAAVNHDSLTPRGPTDSLINRVISKIKFQRELFFETLFVNEDGQAQEESLSLGKIDLYQEKMTRFAGQLETVNQFVRILSKIREKYQRGNTSRLVVIDRIEQNFLFGLGECFSSGDVASLKAKILRDLMEVSEAVTLDHKSSGASSFLGIFQPKSTLAALIENTVKQLNAIELPAPQALEQTAATLTAR